MHLSSAAATRESGKSAAYVLLLTGPAGAGKSAVAERWASRRATPTAHIALDDVRQLVKAGYADPARGWTAETARQLELARRGCVALARLYVEAGITCVVDDAVFPAWEPAAYAPWDAALGALPHALVALMPSYATVRARNALRRGRQLLPEDLLRVIYDLMLPWRQQTRVPVLDNSAWSLDETAERLSETVRALGLDDSTLQDR